jgi:hypothetical protein
MYTVAGISVLISMLAGVCSETDSEWRTLFVTLLLIVRPYKTIHCLSCQVYLGVWLMTSDYVMNMAVYFRRFCGRSPLYLYEMLLFRLQTTFINKSINSSNCLFLMCEYYLIPGNLSQIFFTVIHQNYWKKNCFM